ncbi:3987_t:CDS:2 [Dentiscutata erythropus]|uniref:3987_t:CDS:1 n=1 Tax=Dentiscutata erythropus TaxID=1348616 RepID=A0A9N8VLE3_9GLOM|nr:3987_t:CDS:2 [Dentiscutata erythropus]
MSSESESFDLTEVIDNSEYFKTWLEVHNRYSRNLLKIMSWESTPVDLRAQASRAYSSFQYCGTGSVFLVVFGENARTRQLGVKGD